MQEKYTVSHHQAGTIHIDHLTGALNWEKEAVDPLLKRFAQRYLIDEGFIEHALGLLDPEIDQETAALLKDLIEP